MGFWSEASGRMAALVGWWLKLAADQRISRDHVC
jgi:hypothetical protein